MLAPHHRENAEFGIRRIAAENSFQLLIFVGSQVVLPGQFRSDQWFAHESSTHFSRANCAGVRMEIYAAGDKEFSTLGCASWQGCPRRRVIDGPYWVEEMKFGAHMS